MTYHVDNETKSHGSVAQTIEVAIEESKRENRTVELLASRALGEALLAECEGHDDDGLYWGEDVNGNEWQVRLV